MAEIDASNKRIKGVFIEAGGNVKQDGVIRTDKDAIVGIKTNGNYESNKGEIIQVGEKSKKWHQQWWGKIIIGVIIGVIVWLIQLFLIRLF